MKDNIISDIEKYADEWNESSSADRNFVDASVTDYLSTNVPDLDDRREYHQLYEDRKEDGIDIELYGTI